jgi:hypothetical protein
VAKVVPSEVVAYIDLQFPGAKVRPSGTPELTINAEVATALAALADLIGRVPDELISVRGERQVEFWTSLATIRQIASNPPGPGGSHLHLRSTYDLDAVGLIRRALEECPDEAPASEVRGLEFVDDADYRLVLLVDVRSASSAFANGEWKAATVISGSLVEALLLWSIQQKGATEVEHAVAQMPLLAGQKPRKADDLDSWDLWQYIKVASALGIILTDTANQCDIAKNFRNLIHPGRAKRLQQTCDRATALSALAAVEHVVRDLTTYFGKSSAS